MSDVKPEFAYSVTDVSVIVVTNEPEFSVNPDDVPL